MSDASLTGDAVATLPGPAAGVGYRRRHRRRWTLLEKRSILREIAESGEPVAQVARRYGVNDNLVFAWRAQARAGRLGGTLLSSGEVAARATPAAFIDLGVLSASPSARAEVIEIVLPSGVVVRAPASAVGEPLHLALVAVKAAGL